MGTGVSPKWSPDGQELYYRGDDAIMAVRLDSSDGFPADAAVPLFPDRYVPSVDGSNFADRYAIAPDGRFLMLKGPPQGDSTSELVVVRNWVEEFKGLVPIR